MKYIKKYENDVGIKYLVGKLISSYKDEYSGNIHLLEVLDGYDREYHVYSIEPKKSTTFMLYKISDNKYRTSYNFVYEILYSSVDYDSSIEKYNFYSDSKKYNL